MQPQLQVPPSVSPCMPMSELIAAMPSSISTAANGLDPEMDYEQLRKINAQISLDACVSSVEKILDYKFNDRELIKQALTHPSYTESTSYQRLEFVGDAALGLAFANFVFLAYPSLEPGQLSLLRAANISTEKLARVAVKHGLYRFVRHNASALDEKEVPPNSLVALLEFHCLSCRVTTNSKQVSKDLLGIWAWREFVV